MSVNRQGLAVLAFGCVFSLFTTSIGLAQTPKESAWKLLVNAIHGTKTNERTVAVRVLGLMPGDDAAVGLAEKSLADPKPEVRAAAATALGQMHSKASVEKLKELLADKDLKVVLASAHALCALKDKACYDVFYALLSGQRKSNAGFLAEQTAMFTDPKKLAQLGFEEGIGFVPFAGIGWEAIRTVSKGRNEVPPAKLAAASILADDPDPNSGGVLLDACKSGHWQLRVAALEAIARRGDPTLRVKIEPLLDDPRMEIRFTASAAVLRLGAIAEKGEERKK